MYFLKKVFNFVIRNVKKYIELLKFYLLYPIARMIYRGRVIYLVSERGKDARDNGYYMYKYIRTKHPELECYYVIDKASIDYEKVNKYGNVVDYKSLKHYLLFIAATYRISTHIMGFAPNMNFYAFHNARHRIRGKLIFLQHGVIKDDLKTLYQEKTKVDIFICGAKPEYDYVSQKFHYINGEVKYTGLARYDGLQKYETKRQILVMPTWRMYLQGMTNAEFCKSDYFRHWNALLNDEKLEACLEKYNMKLLFYPHFEIQKYISFFKSKNKRVIIADFGNYDVQTLLKESQLLVTDYSSVFFDFAYMKKSCIYYQFDEDAFFAKHYEKGYFDYRTMGFGPVIIEHKECINELVHQFENGFTVKEEYLKRMEAFFPLHDDKNCDRIFKEIEALK